LAKLLIWCGLGASLAFRCTRHRGGRVINSPTLELAADIVIEDFLVPVARLRVAGLLGGGGPCQETDEDAERAQVAADRLLDKRPDHSPLLGDQMALCFGGDLCEFLQQLRPKAWRALRAPGGVATFSGLEARSHRRPPV